MGGATLEQYGRRDEVSGFNRRGDSLGGATCTSLSKEVCLYVSIAEAILWGEQLVEEWTSRKGGRTGFNRRGDSLGGATSEAWESYNFWMVSIAEAILWGEQLW